MINTRLIKLAPKSMGFIKLTVFYQWLGLIFNILAVFATSSLIEKAFLNTLTTIHLVVSFVLIGLAISVRFISNIRATHYSYHASRTIKNDLRALVYQKLLKLGINYNQSVSTSKVIQMSTEGVEQIEIYFSRYLPQLFYSLLAPLTLFCILSFLNIKVAFVLLICVPLIPISIIGINKFAKKLFSKYWASYTGLGDHFLDNLQGLTTLKVYNADEHYNDQMNKDAEHFRKITMKVLTMQLNSITLMDLIAYGGAALGIIGALMAFAGDYLTLSETVVFILLTSEFFIPLRLLGSFFHVAMNGMAAAQNIFNLLDTPTSPPVTEGVGFTNGPIEMNQVSFHYDKNRPIINNISLTIPKQSFVSIVGKSGCGKSTLASLLMGFNTGYTGGIKIDGISTTQLNATDFMAHVCIVNHQNYLFKGTIRENLQLANQDATDQQMLHALQQVNLLDFVSENGGLDYTVLQNASNLSGGQRQRLALARALLHDAMIYIFDEATSNIDVESEEIFHHVIKTLTRTKTIILISHRLASVVDSDRIFVLDQGNLIESGTHQELLNQQGVYHNLFMSQQALESIYKGGTNND